MENTGADWQDFLYGAFLQLLLYIPIIAVYLTGIVIAFIKSKEYPRISLLSGAGFGILLISSVMSASISFLALYLYNQGYSAERVSYITYIIGFVLILFSASAAALLLRAIWKDRA